MAQQLYFYKKMQFDVFILTLKYLMKNKGIEHISGLCESELLKKEMTEKELSDIFFKAVKNKIFVKRENEVHINFEIYKILYALSQAKKIVTIHKPSYENEKLITLTKVDEIWLLTIQNAKKNEVRIMADSNFDNLYSILEPELKKKDINRKFHSKKVNKELKKLSFEERFLSNHNYQLAFLPIENKSGKQAGEAALFHVFKKEFNLLLGELEEGRLSTFQVDILEEKIKEYLNTILDDQNINNPEEEQENKKKSTERKAAEEEPYTRFSFQRLSANADFPHSIRQLLSIQLKTCIKQLMNWRSWIKLFIIQLIFALVVILWNMYGLCYLNDTFRLAPTGFWGSATAYLFAGTVGRKNNINGLTIFKNAFDTTLLAGSFYCLLGILFRNFTKSVMGGQFLDSFFDLRRFPNRISLYLEKSSKGIGYYIWMGILISAPIGLILWNPFTVGLLAIMLLLSCVKADNSGVSVPIMIYCCASQYKKIKDGRKKEPLFGIIQLRVFGISIGFMVYSLVNILLWKIFAYNFWVRLVFTILLILLALFGLGIIKINKPQKVISCLVLCLICTVLIVLAQKGIVVYADDGGWTESGGTLLGLINNTGFATILGLSTLLAICTLGGSLMAAAIAGAVVGVGALAWSSATETGRETAADFMMGSYSPYGGDSKIASAVNTVVGFVPVIGEVWGGATAVRDAKYNFANGNELSGLLNLVCGGLSIKGLGDGINSALYGMDDVADSILSGTKSTVIQDQVGGLVENADNAINEFETKISNINETSIKKTTSAKKTYNSSNVKPHYNGANNPDYFVSHHNHEIIHIEKEKLTMEVLELSTDEELKEIVNEILQQCEEEANDLVTLFRDLKEYLDSVEQGEIDREVIQSILEKEQNH